MYIRIYKDGTQISEGTGLTPISIGPLNATNSEESAAVEIVIKADTGYTTVGNTTVSFEGASAAKWSICNTAAGTYASTLTIATPITDVGKSVFIKAKATPDEAPANDTTVDIKVAAVVSIV